MDTERAAASSPAASPFGLPLLFGETFPVLGNQPDGAGFRNQA